MKSHHHILTLLLLISASSFGNPKLDSINNYRQYNKLFSSSGQPTPEQFTSLEQAGFQRVIYLAYTNNQTAIKTEDRVVTDLGMTYIQLPINFEKPTIENFQTFSAIMQSDLSTKTLLHCQINLRASTFSFLYRVIHLDVPVAIAKVDLDSVWVPDKNWYKFLTSTLEHYGKNHRCDSCDWGEREFDE